MAPEQFPLTFASEDMATICGKTSFKIARTPSTSCLSIWRHLPTTSLSSSTALKSSSTRVKLTAGILLLERPWLGLASSGELAAGATVVGCPALVVSGSGCWRRKRCCSLLAPATPPAHCEQIASAQTRSKQVRASARLGHPRLSVRSLAQRAPTPVAPQRSLSQADLPPRPTGAPASRPPAPVRLARKAPSSRRALASDPDSPQPTRSIAKQTARNVMFLSLSLSLCAYSNFRALLAAALSLSLSLSLSLWLPGSRRARPTQRNTDVAKSNSLVAAQVELAVAAAALDCASMAPINAVANQQANNGRPSLFLSPSARLL